jgi:hypothetical protein
MPLKRTESPVGNAVAPLNGEGREPFELRENPRVNAQIDDYIKQNSKRWDFIKSMPRERLERALVWEKVRFGERQQKLNSGLFRRMEANPALKKAYDALMAQLPEAERQQAGTRIARTLVFSQSRAQRQNTKAAVNV